MQMHDVLIEDLLNGVAPVYEKEPGVAAFVVDGEQRFDYGNFPCHFVDGVKIIEIAPPVRVHVPLSYSGDDDDDDVKTLALVKAVAKCASVEIEYDGSFDSIRKHFDSVDLPLGVVVKNPSVNLAVPGDLETVEHPGVETDRFYCLTHNELLGRMPTRADATGRNAQRGFLIFNPKGILTMLLEPRAAASRAPAGK